MLIYWQTVLIDERPNQHGLRWPPSWNPGTDYIHRVGPIMMRGWRGREYLTSDVVYADLANVISVRPTNNKSPLYGRPSHVAKRLYPLDPYNRSFAFTLTFHLHSEPNFIVEPRMQSLPSTDNLWSRPVRAEDIAHWVSKLQLVFVPRKQVYGLHEIGSVLGSHLRRATQGDVDVNLTEKFSAVGNSVLLSARMYFSSGQPGKPDLVADKPPGIPGRPFVAISNSAASFVTRRRMRTYALRTFAEISVANYLHGHLARRGDEMPDWISRRGQAALSYLSRPAPYGLSGETGRQMWLLSVSRPGAKVGQMQKLARERLADVLAPANSEQTTHRVIVMGDNYTFNAPVGAAGRYSHGVGTVGLSQAEASRLAHELVELSRYLSSRNPQDPDAAALADAAAAAQKGDLGAIDGKLKRVSRTVIGKANDLALAVAGAVIAHAIGLG
jgi:hypothetical protein